MPVTHRIGVGLVGATLMFVVAACQPAPVYKAQPASASQALSTVLGTTIPGTSTPEQADDVMWGRVPYCNCLADSATDNVAGALKKANLTVNLKELSPRDGWLYFAVTYDPQSATSDQVNAAMRTGGAEVLTGPP